MIRHSIFFILLLTLCSLTGEAQNPFTIPRAILTDTSSSTISNIPSNGVSHIKIYNDEIWLGTSKGLARSTNGGANWQSFRENSSFANDGIFAFDISNSFIWVSTGYDFESSDNSSVQTGSGYAYSIDNGFTWNHVGQALDGTGDSLVSYGINDSMWVLPIVVPQQNVTFDVSISPSTVWIASWSSGLRRTSDLGAHWDRVLLPLDSRNTIFPYDTLWTYAASDTLHQRRIFPRYDPRRDLNLLAFSVLAIDDDTIWCGTAGGVNKSTDGGYGWTKFSSSNQQKHILGNWVIAIDKQTLPNNKQRIWTTNWLTVSPEDYGVSYTDDGGQTWTNLLVGVKAYDFAFKDSVVYIASDDGVYRTEDNGVTFTNFSTFSDNDPRYIIRNAKVYSVDLHDDTVYIATNEGLVKTIDNSSHAFGESWQIVRRSLSVGNEKKTFAYPNPFSPGREVVRIHYGLGSSNSGNRSVKIEIFDFGMNRLRTLISQASRLNGEEYDEEWDGKDDRGDIVPNGVYFYNVISNDEDPIFGKILVLK